MKKNKIPSMICSSGIVNICAAVADSAEALRKFSMVAYTGSKMDLMGFLHPVVVDLVGLDVGEKSRPILMEHCPDRIVGHTESVTVDGSGVTASGVISGVGEAAQEIIGSADNGFPWQASIGARVVSAVFVPDGKTATANGQDFSGPVYIVRRSVLGEISFVALGADDATSARLVASADMSMTEGMTMEFEQWCEEQSGKKYAELTEEEIAGLREKYDAEMAAADSTPAEKATPAEASAPAAPAAAAPVAQASALAAETARVKTIGHIAAHYPEVRASAIREGLTVEETEKLVIKAMRESIPMARNYNRKGGGDMDTKRVVEASLCMSSGVATEEELYKKHGEKVVEAARKTRNCGIRWAAEQIAASSGIDLPSDYRSSDWVRAAFSTSDLGGIVGAVANKALAKSFGSVASIAERIAAPVSHANFHSHTVYSMAMNGDMAEVGPDGTLKHLSLGNESRTRQLKTYGSLLSVTRQDITNDELGALTETAQRMGRKAAVAREKAMFTAINGTGAGSTHFTAAHDNYIDGADTVLSITSLSEAVQTFRNQTGPDGDPVMIEPRILLVPPALEETAKALMDRSASMIVTALASASSKAKEPDVNVWAGNFEVLVSPWLENSNLTGYSTTAWYLIADPRDVPAFEIAYLNGLQSPTVEYQGVDGDINVLGATWRVYWDFGVALGEYRAGVKSKGAAA